MDLEKQNQHKVKENNMASERVTQRDWDIALDALVAGINVWEDQEQERYKIQSAFKVLRWIIDNKVNVGKVAK